MRRILLVVTLLMVFALPGFARIQSSPVGAAAECNDGMYSTSTGRGTCSHHGGVKRYLNGDDTSSSSASSSDSTVRSSSYDDSSSSGSEVAAWSVETSGERYPATGTDPSSFGDPGALPTTGGAPLAMSGIGSLIALAAFGLRRRLR